MEPAKWGCCEDEEEEALSLIDLPLPDLIREYHSPTEDDSPTEPAQDFNFPATSDSFPKEAVMRPADELFSGGRIKPLSTQVRRETPAPVEGTRARSHASSYSPIRIRSLFCDCTSPKAETTTSNSSCRNHRKLPAPWEILRGGLVRASEAEVYKLKYNSPSRRSSGRKSEEEVKMLNDSHKERTEKQVPHSKNLGIFNSCKSSAVEVVTPWKIGLTSNVAREKRHRSDKQKQSSEREEKQATARDRTFEWLKGV